MFHVSSSWVTQSWFLFAPFHISSFWFLVSGFKFQVERNEPEKRICGAWTLNQFSKGAFVCSATFTLQEIAGDLENSLLYKLEVTSFMSHSSLSMSPPILFQVSRFKFTVLILNCFMFLVFISLEWFSTVFHVSGKCGLSLSRFCFMFHGMIFAIFVSCFM